MNHVLAVCDSETEYAYQLVDYFSNKKGFPFQVQLFTSEKTLMEYAKDYPVSVAMIAAKDYQGEVRESIIDHVFLLAEDNEEDFSGLRSFYKYQSAENLTKELLEFIAGEGILGRVVVNGKELKLIGVYSPVGKCLKTSFSFVLGQILSKKHKVLYLNMESYSGLGKLLQKDFSTDMSELIYYLQNSKEKFIYRRCR